MDIASYEADKNCRWRFTEGEDAVASLGLVSPGAATESVTPMFS